MISRSHLNRRAYNWLIYDLGDRLLERASCYLKGNLYDLGCGEMPYRDWFLQYADSYTGVDWAASLHELKADVLADLNELLPIKDAQADTVVSLSVMEHLREPQLFLAEAFRILKPGGYLILQVPFMWHVHEAPHDFYRYTRYGLHYLLGKAGFADIYIHAQTGFWSMWTVKFNYQTKRLIRGPRLIRFFATLTLWPIWAINQRIALFFDAFWKCEGETQAYFVVARKP